MSFAQIGENLVLDGENDGRVVTIENWFAAGYAQLASIVTADGVTITYDASYNAMSAILSLPNGGYDYEYWGLAGQFVTQNQYYTANMVLYEVVTQTLPLPGSSPAVWPGRARPRRASPCRPALPRARSPSPTSAEIS